MNKLPQEIKERFIKRFDYNIAGLDFNAGIDNSVKWNESICDFIATIIKERDDALIEAIKRRTFYEFYEKDKGWNDALDSIINLIKQRNEEK